MYKKGIGWSLLLAMTMTVWADGETSNRSVISDYFAGEGRPTGSRPPPGTWQLVDQAEPTLVLEAAEVAEPQRLEQIGRWNRNPGQNRKATRNGFERLLPQRLELEAGEGPGREHGLQRETLDPAIPRKAKAFSGSSVRVEKLRVRSATQLRLRLTDVRLTEGSELWVVGDDERFQGPFGLELLDLHGDLWTPSVFGSSISLVIVNDSAAQRASVSIASVAELFQLDARGEPVVGSQTEDDTSCQEDAQCFSPGNSFSAIEEAQKSIGTYTYMSSGDSYVCTGGLVNDTVPDSFIPYFLTANHCIANGSEASSVEVFWDNYRNSCNGSAPSLASLERSSGSTLLRTDDSADFTLLQLNTVPGGRWFMGWNANSSAVSPGTTLHRISSPGGNPQVYSRTAVDGNQQNVCSGLPRSQFIYSTQLLGGTAGGSSGAPVMLDNGQIVGQLFGDCGENIDDACDFNNLAVDGALSAYWSQVRSYIDPQSNSAPDLAVTLVRAERGPHPLGSSFEIENTVTNVGDQASEAYRISFYLSSNSTITASDVFLGSINRNALSNGDRHERLTTVTVPSGMAPGNYFVGVIIDANDGNESNDVGYDSNRIQVTASGLDITPAVNGAWYQRSTSGQGILIEVFPGLGKVFIAWFTFDTQRPSGSVTARLGEPGQRWLTGLGDISGSRVVVDLAMSSGGVFDRGSPSVDTTSGYGTATIEFLSCNSATLTYNIPSLGRSGTVNLERTTNDSAASCERIRPIFED